MKIGRRSYSQVEKYFLSVPHVSIGLPFMFMFTYLKDNRNRSPAATQT